MNNVYGFMVFGVMKLTLGSQFRARSLDNQFHLYTYNRLIDVSRGNKMPFHTVYIQKYT